VGECQWPVKTKMFAFTGMASCCSTGLSSYWLMCLHRDSTWHPVTGHLNWPANWHRVNGPLVAYFPSLRKKARLQDHHVVCVCPPFQLLSQWTNFHKIWYEQYASGGHPKPLIFNFLLSVRTTCQMQKLVRWKQHCIPSVTIVTI
jgi:hypothetical protein